MTKTLHKTIVFTGPESCGKTTLAKAFWSKINTEFIKEYAREYLQNKTTYNQNDLLEIAKGQQKLIDDFKNNFLINKHSASFPLRVASVVASTKFVVCDTDLLTIKIWSDYKYGNCDTWIIDTLKNNLPDLYVLCKPDFKWQDDPLRENPNNREELYQIYLKEIKQLGVNYIEVEGSIEERLDMLKSILNR